MHVNSVPNTRTCTLYMVHVGGDKNGKGDQQQRQGKAGGGWGFSFIKYILPKKKNEAHLPDDKKPSVSFHDNYVETLCKDLKIDVVL